MPFPRYRSQFFVRNTKISRKIYRRVFFTLYISHFADNFVSPHLSGYLNFYRIYWDKEEGFSNTLGCVLSCLLSNGVHRSTSKRWSSLDSPCRDVFARTAFETSPRSRWRRECHRIRSSPNVPVDWKRVGIEENETVLGLGIDIIYISICNHWR